MPCGDGGGIHSWHIQGTVRGSVYLWWSKLWWVKGSSRVRSDGLLIQSFVGHCKGFRFYPEWFGKFWPNCMYPLLTCSFTQSCFWNLSILICVAMVDSFSLLYIFIALYYRVLFALLSLKDSFSFFCPHVYMSLSVCSCMGEEVGISQHLQCHTEIICGWIKRWRARLSCLSCGQLSQQASPMQCNLLVISIQKEYVNPEICWDTQCEPMCGSWPASMVDSGQIYLAQYQSGL